MNIWIDIDDVVIDFLKPLLEYVNKNTGKNLSIDEFISRDFHTYLWIKYSDFIHYIFISKVYTKKNICPNFLSFYDKIKWKHNIYFISSRVDFSRLGFNTLEHTKTMLSLNGIHNDVYLTDNKNKFIKNLDIDLFIDDWLHNFVWLDNNKILKVLIKKPWNRKVERERLCNNWKYIPNDIIEVNNILDILKIINNI